MKKNVKKIQVLALMISMAFLLLPFTVNAQGSKANFAGTWAVNAAKSNFGDAQGQGGGQRMGGGNIVVKQEANLLTVDRTRTNQSGESTTTTSKYTLDGKESVNSAGRGESKSVAKWSADGKSLTITTTMTFNSNTFTSTEVWSLTSPNTLSIVRTSPGRDGGPERKTTAVYDKK